MNIYDITIIDGGRQLASRNSHGITIWRLNKGYRQFKDPTPEPDLCESQVVLLPDKKHMVLVKDNAWLLKVDLENKMRVIKKIKLPGADENLLIGSQLTGNGDLLLYWQEVPRVKKTDDDLFSCSENDVGILDQVDLESKIYRLDLIWLDRFGENQSKEMVSKWLEEVEWSADLSDPGLINVYRGAQPLTVFNSLCRLRTLKRPLGSFPIFQNGKTVFLEKRCDDPSENELVVYLGTSAGKCEVVRLNLRGKVHKISEMICGAGRPIFQSMFQPYQRTVNFISETPSHPDLDITLSEKSEINGGPIDSMESQTNGIVNDCKRFVKEDCETFVMTEEREPERGKRKRYCVVYMRPGQSGQWVSAKCGIGGTSDDLNEEEFFKISSMGALTEQGCVTEQFYLVSSLGIVLLKLYKRAKTLKITRFLKKGIKTHVGVVHSKKSKYFYIPTRNVVQVWRENLSSHAFSISLEHDIHHICHGQGDNLMVIDKANYYEISTESMETRKIFRLLDSPGNVGSKLVLNVDVFPSSQPIQLPSMEERIAVLAVVTDIDMLNLNQFPFESLSRCFEEEGLQESILRVAEYYFRKIRETNAEDHIYGPFNPLLFAIYHNQTDLLKTLLETYFYPQSTKNYISPLSFSFLRSYHSAVKVICDYLIKSRQPVKFSRLDFQCLLSSPLGYCHRLLALIPQEPSLKNTRRFLSLKKDIKLFFATDDSELTKQVDSLQEASERRQSKRQVSLFKKMRTLKKSVPHPQQSKVIIILFHS